MYYFQRKANNCFFCGVFDQRMMHLLVEDELTYATKMLHGLARKEIKQHEYAINYDG